MRIAIMGAGSLGTIIGAYLAKDGEDVELITTNEEHVNALNNIGAVIKGTGSIVNIDEGLVGEYNELIPVKALTPGNLKGTYDLVLLLTKQVVNYEVLANLKQHLHDESILLSLQNGVPEESIVEVIGASRVIGGEVSFGATLKEAGVTELTTEYNAFRNHAFEIGELDGSVTDRIKEVKEMLNIVGGTEITTNLTGTKWSKLLVNVAMSGMSTALGGTFGDVLRDDTAVISAIMLANETLNVGESLGVNFEKLAGHSLDIFKLYEDMSNLPVVIGIAKMVFAPQALLKASMLQDLERKKRKCEVDFINGVVVEKGKLIGIETPFNDLVVKLIKEAEDNKEVPNFERNILYFKELVEKL